MDAITKALMEELNHFHFTPNQSQNRKELEAIAHKLGGTFHLGATRYCIVFPRQKIAFKICYAAIDYNATEYENYQKAIEYGIEKILLPIEFIGTTKFGVNVYSQPKYSTSHNELKYKKYTKYKNALGGLFHAEIVGKIANSCYDEDIPTIWLARATQIYGKKFMRAFEEWTKECHVNDLHGGNCGYLKKQPIIIDYAGYWPRLI